MAINIKKYVDISTTFPSASVAGRSFGGLVFTGNPCTARPPELEKEYDTLMGLDETGLIGVVYLQLEEVRQLFGDYSVEYKFARGYYNYISPSGRFASKLAFTRVGEGEKLTAAFDRVNSATNLFGSFTFLGLKGSGSSSSGDPLDEIVQVATTSGELDAKYLFVVNRPGSDTYDEDAAIDDCKKFANISGTCFIYGGSEVSAFMPMAILGATDYSNGQVTNFMFKQFDDNIEPPTVFDDKTYTNFNKANVNFYGQTQTNGQTLNFYQRGFNTDSIDTAVYCNEMWFKSICETALLQLLTTRERLPADALGVDLVRLEVIDCCSAAVRNGMFMQKELNAKDVRSVREIVLNNGGEETDVGSIEADIVTKGYSVYAYLTEGEDEERFGKEPEKYIVYFVFYGTADSVRYIKGNDILLK